MRFHLPMLILFAVSTRHAAGLPAIQEGHVTVLPQGEMVTVTTFVDKQGKPHGEAASVTLRWDDKGLELVFDCTDSAIADTVATDRDSTKTWKDDSVGVLLDIGHSHDVNKKPIALMLSAAGGLFDRRGRDTSYTCTGIESKVTRTDGGWRGTIRAPFKGLWSQPRPGDVWGLNLTRIDHEGRAYRNMKFLSWTPFAENTEKIDHWGHVVFAPAGAKADDRSVLDAKSSIRKAHEARYRDHVLPHAGSVLVLPKGKAQTIGELFLQNQEPAKLGTTATVKWDDAGLTVAFTCTDPAITAEHKERDDIKLWKDDCVTVWLDIGHTHNTAGKLTMLQVGASGAFHDARDSDIAYNARGAKTTATKTADGWLGTIHVPWKGLGVEAPKPGQLWGANLTRIDQPGVYVPTKTEYTSWAPIGRQFVQLDRWGHFLFAGPDGAGAEDAKAALQADHASRGKDLLGTE